MPDENPYASPKTVEDFRTPAADQGAADVIRRRRLPLESIIRSLGMLYYLIAIVATMLVLVGVGLVASSWASTAKPWPGLFESIGVAIYGLSPAVLWATASGLRGLRGQPARLFAIGLHMLVLAASLVTLNPVLAVYCGYVLWRLTGRESRFLFSTEYQEVVLATPYLQPSTPMEIKVLAFGIALLMLLAFVSLM